MTQSARPRIGVTTSVKGSYLSWLFNRFAIWRAGGQAVRLSMEHHVVPARLDGVVIGGGDDIGAALYGGEITLDVRIDPARDRLEQDLLTHALGHDMPILGICRGAQMINVALGGNLIQDIAQVYENAPRGRMLLPRRAVAISRGSALRKILERDVIRVNSLHRQAVARLGRGLRIAGQDRGGMVQAIEDPTRAFLIGVQWHPELLFWDPHQIRLFRQLCRHAREFGG